MLGWFVVTHDSNIVLVPHHDCSVLLLIRLSAVMTVCHHWGPPVMAIKATFTREHKSALL